MLLTRYRASCTFLSDLTVCNFRDLYRSVAQRQCVFPAHDANDCFVFIKNFSNILPIVRKKCWNRSLFPLTDNATIDLSVIDCEGIILKLLFSPRTTPDDCLIDEGITLYWSSFLSTDWLVYHWIKILIKIAWKTSCQGIRWDFSL